MKSGKLATALILIAVTLISLGCWLIYRPAGYIALGVLLGALGVILTIGGEDDGNAPY